MKSLKAIKLWKIIDEASWSAYRNIDYRSSCPNAEKALADYMTLHIHECWTEKEIEDTVKALKKVEEHCLR